MDSSFSFFTLFFCPRLTKLDGGAKTVVLIALGTALLFSLVGFLNKQSWANDPWHLPMLVSLLWAVSISKEERPPGA